MQPLQLEKRACQMVTGCKQERNTTSVASLRDTPAALRPEPRMPQEISHNGSMALVNRDNKSYRTGMKSVLVAKSAKSTESRATKAANKAKIVSKTLANTLAAFSV